MQRISVRIAAPWIPAVFGTALSASCIDSAHLVATGTMGADDASVASSGSQSCPTMGPPGVPPLPTPLQVAYQRMELTAFVHFGLETFDDTETGLATDTPALFDPTNLDASEWAIALKDAGFGQAMLSAKQDTGFCLWPSAYTDYSVKNSPWKGGQGDVVRDFTDAVRAAGMRVALDLSPWDKHYPSSSSSYETYFRSQLTELLTQYGPVAELWLDGQNAPALDWPGILQLARQLQPDVLVEMGYQIAVTGADIRYGNQAIRSTSSVVPPSDGGVSNVWDVAEAPVSDRGSDWYWHPSGAVISLSSLQTIYFNTVGMNTTLLLGVPPAMTGLYDTQDLGLLQQFAVWYSSLYQTNLLRGQPATADSTWGHSGFDAARAVDDDISTFWAAASGATSARLEVTLASGITFNVISIREPIECGERSTAYHIEIEQNGVWATSPTDASGATVAGTVIGERQLWQMSSTTADAIALVIDSARDVPAIAEFSVY